MLNLVVIVITLGDCFLQLLDNDRAQRTFFTSEIGKAACRESPVELHGLACFLLIVTDVQAGRGHASFLPLVVPAFDVCRLARRALKRDRELRRCLIRIPLRLIQMTELLLEAILL